ncbi:unnamed protein product, partial [Rotaria magnacalcarata]
MDDQSNRSNTNDLPMRSAKLIGNENRQLSTYIDNTSAASSNSKSEIKPGILNVDNGNLMALSNYTENDAESLPSSFSPPPAPSSPPSIINESELPTASREIEIVLSEKQKLEDEKQNIGKMIKRNEEEINKYINILDVLGLSKHCFLGVQIKGKLSDEVLIKLYDDKAPIPC